MVKVIERAMRRLFPELFANYHLPMFAKVISVADAPASPGIVNAFRPRYAVDIKILKSDGTIDQRLPTYSAVPLPANMVGHDKGMWGFPEVGTIVEVAFAYGSPTKPFIRTILSLEATCPALKQGEQVWQHSPNIEQRADTAGNWSRVTDKSIQDSSTKRLINSLEDVQNYLQSTIKIDANSTDTIGGTKSIEAMGALKLKAGEQAILLALSDLKLATNAVLHTYSKENTEMKTDAQLNVMAKTLAHIETEGQVWLGSADVNAIQILVDLIEVVSALAQTLSTHTHPTASVQPNQSAAITNHKTTADGLKSSLEPITE